MHIPEPESLKKDLRPEVSPTGFGISNACLNRLTRKGQDRQQLRGALLAGAQSESSAPVDAAYFDALRTRISGKAAR